MQSFYKTQNLYEASYLFSKGHPITGKEITGSKVTLLFEDGDKVRKDTLDYYNGGSVKAKVYSDAYRTLKDMVFQR